MLFEIVSGILSHLPPVKISFIQLPRYKEDKLHGGTAFR